MMRDFHILDPRRIRATEFFKPHLMLSIWTDDTFYKKTLEDAGKVFAMVIWKHYQAGNYIASLVISQDIKPRHLKELRRFIYQTIIDFQMERVETASVKHDTLTRWHKFIGFTSEGVKRKYAFGKDYEMWALVKGEEF